MFYASALAYWGLEKGGAIAVAGSVIQCSVMFWLYDRMKIDWLLAHAARQLEDKENLTRFEKLAVWMGKDRKTLRDRLIGVSLFFGLTTFVDPLIVAIHFQRKHFNGLKLGDWGLLFASVATANLWWLIILGSLVTAAKFAIHIAHLGLIWITPYLPHISW